MKFWDSSALVPLIVEEARSSTCRQMLRADPRLIVWTLTRTEILSALCRRRRDRLLDERELQRAAARMERLAERWTEIDAIPPVREQAERLLRMHPIRAADALQLGAALVAFDLRPRRRGFLSLDEALLEAAGQEGFDALKP